MGSLSSSSVKDNRLAIDGDIGQVTAPESALANSFGVAIVTEEFATSSPTISYGDITMGVSEENLIELVNTIMQSSIDTATAAVQPVTDLAVTATDIVEGIKTPLSQYLPYVVLGIIGFVLLQFRKR